MMTIPMMMVMVIVLRDYLKCEDLVVGLLMNM